MTETESPRKRKKTNAIEDSPECETAKKVSKQHTMVESLIKCTISRLKS